VNVHSFEVTVDDHAYILDEFVDEKVPLPFFVDSFHFVKLCRASSREVEVFFFDRRCRSPTTDAHSSCYVTETNKKLNAAL
jgi:hypothetical protein